jgi:hypothetical protein
VAGPILIPVVCPGRLSTSRVHIPMMPRPALYDAKSAGRDRVSGTRAKRQRPLMRSLNVPVCDRC